MQRPLINRFGLGGAAMGIITQVAAMLAVGMPILQPCRAAGPAAGPLRVHPVNPRYFASGRQNPDGTLEVVYLTGAHTWNNLVDMRREEGEPPFDFNAYLDFLEKHGHNFIRLWAWDSTYWDTRANGSLGKESIHHVAPLPWARTGPGEAFDGKPRFDLLAFDQEYFHRLRRRVDAARQRGIYVSVMLFEGWGLMHGNLRQGTLDAWAWRSHPFHRANNVNGIHAGDERVGAVHQLGQADVQAIQEAYLRKVVDTVNDLDNVLYEVINEGGSRDWDWWVVRTVQEYERSKPHRHPVGITGHGAERLDSMLASPADWISPGSQDGYRDDPPAWDGAKVSLLDTDHVWGVGGSPAWVWKSFLRGHNPLFMDPYDGSVLGAGDDPRWEPVRRAMGHARALAQAVDLASMVPRGELSSTGYCLASPGRAYLVYVPGADTVTIDLADAQGDFLAEWIEPVEGTRQTAGVVSGGGRRELTSVFPQQGVLYLRLREGSP